MRRITITTFFIILSIFILSKISVYADPSIPGITCGNALDEDPKNRVCCKKDFIQPDDWLQDLLSWPSRIPIIGDTVLARILDIRNSVLQLQRSANVEACVVGFPSDLNNPSCTCLSSSQLTPTPVKSIQKLCSNYLPDPNSYDRKKCDECANYAGIWTGLGVCAYGDLGRFITETVFGLGAGLAGVIALLCIIYSAFIMQTSGGNPERLKKAQENLTSCIMGLMLIIFSIFILRLIGVDILRIPGFR